MWNRFTEEYYEALIIIELIIGVALGYIKIAFRRVIGVFIYTMMLFVYIPTLFTIGLLFGMEETAAYLDETMEKAWCMVLGKQYED